MKINPDAEIRSQQKKESLNGIEGIAFRDDIEKLREELKQSEIKLDRLKQVFSILLKAFKYKIGEFREAVFSLLGYKLDIADNAVISLLSVYAFSPNDTICVQKGENSLQLLETPFLSNAVYGISKEVEIYYKRGKSIPALLAGVTLNLWEKSTIQVS